MSELFKDSLKGFLSPINEFLEDDSISEILINGPKEIFVERKGNLEKTEAFFEDETHLQAAIRNIAQYVGRRIDDQNLSLDARLPDGSRIHAVLPPCAKNGTTVAIRKFGKSELNLKDLVRVGALSLEAAKFLDICVHLGKNLLVSGGTGSGKSTILKVLASRTPKKCRLIVIEDSSELTINLPHVVFFETKEKENSEDVEVGIQELVRSAMRLRPDRIIVGEVRGEEARDLINVMNTGHEGSMGTVHANSPKDALIRLETLAMMGDHRTPIQAVRRQIASALHLVVQTKRFSDGSRKISAITEVLSVDETGNYKTQDLFLFVQNGKGKFGEIQGQLEPVGNIPTFFNEIEVNALPFKKSLFSAHSSSARTSKKVA